MFEEFCWIDKRFWVLISRTSANSPSFCWLDSGTVGPNCQLPRQLLESSASLFIHSTSEWGFIFCTAPNRKGACKLYENFSFPTLSTFVRSTLPFPAPNMFTENYPWYFEHNAVLREIFIFICIKVVAEINPSNTLFEINYRSFSYWRWQVESRLTNLKLCVIGNEFQVPV